MTIAKSLINMMGDRRVAPGKRLLAILFPKGGERKICSGISSADSLDSRKGLSAQADAS